MKYKLTEEYFETSIFQKTVQEYFDTVLKGILNYKDVIQAKGLFIIDGKVMADLYDMPYHIHILNGLIPSLFLYEKFLSVRGWIGKDTEKNKEAEIYIKTFILGFTFHDADKFTGASWTNAFNELEKIKDKLLVSEFFPEFENYKNDVYFLALSTENRTEVKKNRYEITLDYRHLNEILAPLCNFADGIASIQELDGVEVFYKEAEKALGKINQIIDFKISYIKIHENPYTLLSQNLLNTAGKVLKQNGRSIFYTMRDGILFFGNDLTDKEKELIFEEFENNQSDDIDIGKLVKVTAQQADLSSIVSIGISESILNQIIQNTTNKFLSLSPNGQDKIEYFDDFVKFNELLIEKTELPIDIKINNNKLYLNFSETAYDDNAEFIKIFALQKIMWQNGKINKVWSKSFNNLITSDEELTFEINEQFQTGEDEYIILTKISDLKKYFSSITKSSNALLKTYISIIKAVNILNTYEDDIDDCINDLYKNVINFFSNDENDDKSVLSELYNKYFTYKGNKDFSAIIENMPIVPIKKKMCAYTGKFGTERYVESVAFGMNARGFSNRTVASLKNNISFVSKLMAEENKLRKSSFARPKSNHVIYYDFFETSLDINPDLIKTCIKSRNHEISKDGIVKLDRAAKFQANLKNLEFTEIGSDMISAIWLVRNKLVMVQKLNIRMYITGIMSPYLSHKEVFVYENAPRFIKDLKWNIIRLHEIQMVLDEISILFALGRSRKSINSGLVLNYAGSPNSIFQAFYLFAMQKEQKEVTNVEYKLIDFINKYPNKFKNMTTIEKLVDIALKIDSSAKSGSEETWLIRTALDFLRKNVKEKLGKEDTIQQIAGNIYKTKRLEYADVTVIENFARAVYEELYEKQWKKSLPTINRQKDWIYQFGFVFKQKSVQRMRQLKAAKIKREIIEKGLEVNEENIIANLKKDKLQKYANEYIKLILNNGLEL